MLIQQKPLHKNCLLALIALSCTLGTFNTYAADMNAGADSFDANCAECHSIAKPLKNKKGPSLLGVVGRASAANAGFDYSDAMKAANIIWTPEKLDAYIANPKVVVPNDKMKFKGLANATERTDLIAFLAQQL
jgi:cytochrome c